MYGYILEKYKDFEIKEIQSGYRCKTYLLEKDREKYIYQFYMDYTKYQAKKKYEITNFISKQIQIPEIPKIIHFEENADFASLVTEFKAGIELDKKEIVNYKVFYKDLAKILSKIHSVETEKKFGWIGENGVEEKDNFSDYINDEIKRNILRIKKHNIPSEAIEHIEKKAKQALSNIKDHKAIKPTLLWYDINPQNILVNENSDIAGFLDAGGARIGAKEWDLAFIKMDLCKNKEEFDYFIDNYNDEINHDLLNQLSVIVELDDIAFQLEANIKLDIAFDSNFKETIMQLHKQIEKKGELH